MRAVSPNLLLLLASCCVWQCSCENFQNPDYDLRIFGGHKINITDAPYYAQYNMMQHNKEYVICGAVIVHEKFLVTAGYCARLKTNVINVGGNGVGKGEDYEIEKVFKHPKYHPLKFDYNIAVLKLKKKMIFSDRVNKINMADDSLVPKKGDLMEVVGFGFVLKNRTRYLAKVVLSFVDLPTCRQESGKLGKNITERMFCAGEKGKGVCYGDGGGPLVYKNHFYGILSWSAFPCTESPAVYDLIPKFRDFINGVIKNNS